METRRLPASGAGPSEERLILGSEGIFGFITQAWVRLQKNPRFKQTRTFEFSDYAAGVEASRLLSQSGLNPSNCRLVDRVEAYAMGLGTGAGPVLILGFESSCHPVEDLIDKALVLIDGCAGTLLDGTGSDGSDSAEAWKQSFLQAPYLRDHFAQRGIVAETFETAITWDRFHAFHQRLTEAVQAEITRTCGAGFVTCRFTHVYPDGPAPYFTVVARTEPGKELDHWRTIKQTASRIIVDMGATITHHHAVGKDHVPYYRQQCSPFFRTVLSAAKERIDPQGIFNPGVLL
jgi:alkyldihydroxyacetonephosphate synthase